MAIIISILKWLLMILLALLGLVLVLVACLLFVPARYYVYAQQDNSWRLKGNASWLLHILHFSFEVQEGKMMKKLRIFGIPVSLGEKKSKKKKRKPKKKQKGKKKNKKASDYLKPEGKDQKQRVEEKVSNTETTVPEIKQVVEMDQRNTLPAKPKKTASGTKDKTEKKGKAKYLLSIKALLAKIRKGIVLLARVLTEGPRALIEDTKVEKIVTILQDSNTLELWRIIWANLVRLWRHSKPKKIKGRIHFGTSDPCSTGQILGVIGAGYGFLGTGVKVEPDFENAVLEGYLEVKGRIQVYMLLWILKDVFWSEEWKYFKKQKEK